MALSEEKPLPLLRGAKNAAGWRSCREYHIDMGSFSRWKRRRDEECKSRLGLWFEAAAQSRICGHTEPSSSVCLESEVDGKEVRAGCDRRRLVRDKNGRAGNIEDSNRADYCVGHSSSRFVPDEANHDALRCEGFFGSGR